MRGSHALPGMASLGLLLLLAAASTSLVDATTTSPSPSDSTAATSEATTDTTAETTTVTTAVTTAVTTTTPTTTTTTPAPTTPPQCPYSDDLPATIIVDEAAESEDLFTFTVTDAQGDYVRVKVLNNSDNMFQMLPVDGEPTKWRLHRTDEGKLPRSQNIDVLLELDDGACQANEELTLAVVANNPPQIQDCPGGTKTGPTIPASTGASADVITITADDTDPVTYTMTCVPSDGPFVIDGSSGKISTSRNLEYETEASHQCKVSADDDKLDHAPDNCTVSITITGLNEPPAFTPDTGSREVSEELPPGSQVFSFAGILRDPNDPGLDNVTLACDYSPGSAYSLLEVDTANRAIKLLDGQAFDFEAGPNSITATCTATDGGGLSDDFTLTLTVTDGSDPPEFQRQLFTVTLGEGETGDSGTALDGFVEDPDTGDTKTFSLAPGPGSDQFSIDPSTGVLTHTGSLPPDTASSTYTLSVLVKDSRAMQDNATIEVTVNDLNDNSPVFSPDPFDMDAPVKLRGSMPRGQELATVSATDDDSGTNAQITYSKDPSSSCSDLTVTSDGKVVVSTSPLTHDYNTPCTVVATCQDKGTPPNPCSNTATYHFTWEDPPQMDPGPYEGTIKEVADPGTAVDGISIPVSDTDGFKCRKRANDAPLFDVVHATNASTVTVKYKGPAALDRSVPRHTLLVECTDSNPATSTATVIIDIIPNEAPKCPPNTPGTPIEVAMRTPGTDYPIDVTDPEDDPMQCSFSFSTSNPPLTCDRYTCTCTSTENTKRVSTLLYTATVTVRDERNTVSCVVRFKLDEPNKPPEIPVQPLVTVPEDSQDDPFTERAVYQFDVTDDVLCPEALSCTTSVSPQRFSGRFLTELTGTTLTVKTTERLNKEEPNSGNGLQDFYDFTFQCSDGCKTSDPVTSRLRLTNVDEKPEFRGGDLFVATFKETQTSEVYLDCDLYDVDQDDEVQIKIEPSDYVQPCEPQSRCCVRLVREYDLDKDETRTFRPYTIKALDKDGKEIGGVEATLRVNFELENDNYPECKEQGYEATVTYGTPAGTTLKPLTAIKFPGTPPTDTDKDKGVDGETSCSMVGSNGGSDYVSMHRDCRIVLSESMDGEVEDGQLYHFDIEICDGSPVNPKCGYCRLTVQYLVTTPPPPQPPVTEPPNPNPDPASTAAGTTAASAASTEATEPSSIWSNPGIIALMAILGLLGLGLLGLGGYLIYRACSSAPKSPVNLQNYKPAAKPGQVQQVKPKEQPPKKAQKPKKEPKEPKKPKEKKPEKPPPKPATPPNQVHPTTPSSIKIEEPPQPAHHMFEFHKERFDDADYFNSPVRGGLPDV